MKTKASPNVLIALWLAAAVTLLLCPITVVSAQESSSFAFRLLDEKKQARAQPQYKELCEDIEVMARIIDRHMSEEFKDDYRAESFLSKGCEGFYVPEVGAFFVLRVKFPVFLEEPAEEEEAKPEEMDLWDREKWSLRLGAKGEDSRYENRMVFWRDEVKNRLVTSSAMVVAEVEEHRNKIRDLKREIISILGKYGRRISGLADDERIVVSVLGDSGLGPLISRYGRVTADPRLGSVPLAGAVRSYRRGVELTSARGHLGTTLVISTRVADLPEEPPSEAQEDTTWVHVLAY